MYVARSNSCISANTRLGDDRYLEFRARIRKKRWREGALLEGRQDKRPSYGNRGDGDRQFRNFSSRNYCKSRKGTSIVRRLFTSISIRIINLGRIIRYRSAFHVCLWAKQINSNLIPHSTSVRSRLSFVGLLPQWNLCGSSALVLGSRDSPSDIQFL